jgi:DNA-binding transcriptional LysR family regulator
MDLNHVHLFVRVVEHGGFTAAARAHGLPTSSVSRGVARLEQDLGVTLLRRTTRTVTLTDAGRLYYERARAAVHELTEAGDVASDAGDEPRGLIRMTAPIDAGGSLLAAPLARFLAAHPRITLDLILTGRNVDLIAEGVDLAVRAGRLADSSLIVKKVLSSTLGMYAARSYLARRGAPRRLADLARHDCVVYRGMTRWTLQGPRGNQSVDVTPRLNCDEMAFVVPAIAQGIGIGLLPLPFPGKPADLIPVLPELSIGGGALYLVHPPMRHLPRRVQLLRDFLFEELKQGLAARQAAR